MKFIKPTITHLILLVAIFSIASTVLADTHTGGTASASNEITYNPLAPIPGTESGGGSSVTFTSYILGAYKFLIAGSVVLAILMIIWGGFTYISSDAISGKKEGRKIINQALLGLGLVLASWLILHTINPDLVNFDLNLQIDRADPTQTN